MSNGYTTDAALKLVGDRFELIDRQRLAVRRSACSSEAVQARKKKSLSNSEVAGLAIEIDAFNLITTVEAALGGGVILIGQDGFIRDMASMHGTYRKVNQTIPALEWIGQTLVKLGVEKCLWYLDRPVFNSGRLSKLIEETGAQMGFDWSTELVNCPDPILKASQAVVVTADCVILDGCVRCFNLAAQVLCERMDELVVVDFSFEDQQ